MAETLPMPYVREGNKLLLYLQIKVANGRKQFQDQRAVLRKGNTLLLYFQKRLLMIRNTSKDTEESWYSGWSTCL